jgi:hypothetical protein
MTLLKWIQKPTYCDNERTIAFLKSHGAREADVSTPAPGPEKVLGPSASARVAGGTRLPKQEEKPPAGNWLEDALARLVSIYRSHGCLVRGQGGPPEQELRRIGESLDREGGIDLMRTVWAEFASRCDVRGAARNLEFLWDGIGTWQG